MMVFLIWYWNDKSMKRNLIGFQNSVQLFWQFEVDILFVMFITSSDKNSVIILDHFFINKTTNIDYTETIHEKFEFELNQTANILETLKVLDFHLRQEFLYFESFHSFFGVFISNTSASKTSNTCILVAYFGQNMIFII